MMFGAALAGETTLRVHLLCVRNRLRVVVAVGDEVFALTYDAIAESVGSRTMGSLSRTSVVVVQGPPHVIGKGPAIRLLLRCTRGTIRICALGNRAPPVWW